MKNFKEARRITLYYALKYHGDSKKIMEASKKKEKVIMDYERELLHDMPDCDFVTIVDGSYPKHISKIKKNPPFVIFYRGDLNALDKEACIVLLDSGFFENENVTAAIDAQALMTDPLEDIGYRQTTDNLYMKIIDAKTICISIRKDGFSKFNGNGAPLVISVEEAKACLKVIRLNQEKEQQGGNADERKS